MSDEPRQRTEKGASIPVPTRGDVLRDLRKVAKAPASANGDEDRADDVSHTDGGEQ